MWISNKLAEEQGFTLLEMLIVLAIFSVLTLLSVSMLFRFYEQNEYEQAIERFRLTLHYAQQVAINEKREVRVYVMDDGTVKVMMELNEVLVWHLPTNMKIIISTDKRIVFQPSGNVNQIGSITMKMPQGEKRFSINLSKGRLRYVE